MRRRDMDTRTSFWSTHVQRRATTHMREDQGIARTNSNEASSEQRGVTTDDLEALADILSATSLEDALNCSTTLGFSSPGNLYRSRHHGWARDVQENRWTTVMPMSSRLGTTAASSSLRDRHLESKGFVCSCLQPTCTRPPQDQEIKVPSSSKRKKCGSGGQASQQPSLLQQDEQQPTTVIPKTGPGMRTHQPERGPRGRDAIEEFVFDDNELSFLNAYNTPVDASKRQRIRKSSKLKTVSIIDTLSELLESDDLDRKWSVPTGRGSAGLTDITASLPDITQFSGTEDGDRSQRFSGRIRSNAAHKTSSNKHTRKFDIAEADLLETDTPLPCKGNSRHRLSETCVQRTKISSARRNRGTVGLLAQDTGTFSSGKQCPSGPAHGVLSHAVPNYVTTSCPLSCKHALDASPCRRNLSSKEVPSYMTTPAKSFLSIAKHHNMSISGYMCNNSHSNYASQNHPLSKHLRSIKSYNTLDVGRTGIHEDVTSPSGHHPNGHTSRKDDMDWSRQCFSDSEVRERPREVIPPRGARNGRGTTKRTNYSRNSLDAWKGVGSMGLATTNSKSCWDNYCSESRKSKRNLKSTSQSCGVGGSGNSRASKQRTRVPEWIQSIFAIAKKGDVELLKESLKDMDAALIRNLSDQNGNNLWHIAATNNHLACIQWLCEKERQEVLRDENKHGLNPVVCAVKHGSLESLQWLIRYTNGKRLVSLPEGSRCLLHFAAKYGQERLLHWLAEYMQENDLSLSSRDAEGNTALHLAARYGRIMCVKALVLHSADITVRNELGLKAYDLAYHSGQLACADYLLALEACLSLSADHLLLESDVQHLRSENTELKGQFKELLLLTRRLVKGQEELLDTFGKLLREERRHAREAEDNEENSSTSKDYENSGKSSNRKRDSHLSTSQLRVLQEEYAKWRNVILPEEEGRLHMVEEKWRRLRLRPYRRTETSLTPVDVLRTQFAQVLAKATDPRLVTDLRLLSSSESSVSDEEESDVDEGCGGVGDDLPCSDTAFSEDGPLEDLISHESVPESQRSAAWNVRLGEPVPDFVPQEGRRLAARKMQLSENLHAPQPSHETCRKLSSSTWKTKECETTSRMSMTSKSETNRAKDVTSSHAKKTSSSFGSSLPPSKGNIPPETSTPSSKLTTSDVNLRVFFERNPELRQEGQTCSVVEVLEPSSSENEEWPSSSQVDPKKSTKSGGRSCKEKDFTGSGNSSSSSVRSCRDYRPTPLSGHGHASGKTSNQRSQTSSSGNDTRGGGQSGTKKGSSGELIDVESTFPHKSVFHSVSSQVKSSHHDVRSPCISSSHAGDEDTVGDVSPVTGSRSEDSSYESGDTVIPLADLNNAKSESEVPPGEDGGSNYVEPDLLKGTKATLSTNMVHGHSPKQSAGISPRSSPEIQIPEDSVCANELHCRGLQTSSETLGSASDTSMEGPKKRGFLSKFTLRGRWSSKQKAPRSKKPEEISPEEFREIYSRSSLGNSCSSSSPLLEPSHTTSQELKLERVSPKSAHVVRSSASVTSVNEHSMSLAERDGKENVSVMFPTFSEKPLTLLGSRPDRIPPPVNLVRRGPPPAPPINNASLHPLSLFLNDNDDAQHHPDTKFSNDGSAVVSCDDTSSLSIRDDHPSAKLSTSISSGSTFGSSTLEGQGSFTRRPSSSASKSDSLSRPASSASRVESPPRSEDNYKSDGFQLCKASSTSTELLVTPDSSTAGRQSPAPSEVSKTESALSPPSDVSKTESTRHHHHLGKIEEIAANNRDCAALSFKDSVLVKTATIVDVSVANKVVDSPEMEPVFTSLDQDESSSRTTSKIKVLNNGKKSEKPWYEVSDDEDTFNPAHYKMGRVRSSSEDEADEVDIPCSSKAREPVFNTSGNMV